MPTLPIIRPRVPLATAQLAQVPAGGFGQGIAQGLGDIGETLFKLQDGADKAEAGKIIADSKAKLDASLTGLTDTVTDPQQFQQQATEQTKTIYDDALNGATNGRVKNIVTNQLSNDIILHGSKIKHGTFQKTHDKALGDYYTAEDQMVQDSIKGGPAAQADLGKLYGQLTASMEHDGYLKAGEGSKRIIEFNQKVQRGTMNLLAANQPEDFMDNMAKGAYATNNPVDVQAAADIAGRAADRQARMDEKKAKQQSDEAMRGYEEQAGNRQMSIPEMTNTARFYGWKQSDIDRLTAMQIGVKIASPYEKQLIEQAMAPANRNAVYTMGDVKEAENNLKTLAKNRNVSTETAEYNSQMIRLQGMTNNLRIQGSVQDSKEKGDQRSAISHARQAIDDIYRQYQPGPQSDQQIAEKAGLKRQLDGMTPQESRALVDQTDKKLKDQFEKNRSPTVNVNKLRGQLGNK